MGWSTASPAAVQVRRLSDTKLGLSPTLLRTASRDHPAKLLTANAELTEWHAANAAHRNPMRRSGAPRTPRTNAVSLLTADHRQVEGWFDALAGARSSRKN